MKAPCKYHVPFAWGSVENTLLKAAYAPEKKK